MTYCDLCANISANIRHKIDVVGKLKQEKQIKKEQARC